MEAINETEEQKKLRDRTLLTIILIILFLLWLMYMSKGSIVDTGNGNGEIQWDIYYKNFFAHLPSLDKVFSNNNAENNFHHII